MTTASAEEEEYGVAVKLIQCKWNQICNNVGRRV